MKCIQTFFLIILFSLNVYSQTPSSPVDIQKLIEDLFPMQDEDVNYEEMYSALLLFYSHPIDLNKATKIELRSLFLLSEPQINNFLNYRDRYGNLLSIYELQAIPGFDLATIQNLLPFVKIRNNGLASDNRPLIKRIFTEPNNYLLLRYERTLEKKKGYTSSNDGATRYLGSPDKLLMRFRVSHSQDFSIGFTAEKDPGESLRGPDFSSFHFQLKNKGKVKNFILGDYRVQLGQSLLSAAGFSVGKGAETITTTRRVNHGILPHTSVMEYGFYRGAAVNYELSSLFEFTGFYSRLKQDATPDGQDSTGAISNLRLTGLHRTPGEIAAKNKLIQQTTGGSLQYNSTNENLQISLSFVADRLNRPIQKSVRPYKYFDLTGGSSQNVSLSYNYVWQNFSFFGEAAKSIAGGFGMIAGMMTSLTPHLQTSIILRNYARDFHSLHGDGFGENSGNNNEQGVYWGLKFTPSRKFQFTAYFDRFTFPWLKYRVDAPSDGHEFMFRGNYRPSRSEHIYIQFRQQSKAINPSAGASQKPIYVPFNGIKRNYLFNLDYPLDKIFSTRSRVQYSSYDYKGKRTAGFAIIQDLNIDLRKFRISTRFALFDTDDYENRQYVYERDVLYGFSIPPYSGRGSRQYILLQYKLSRQIDLWFRYARTHFRDRDSISSGLEEISGNKKSDIKIQMRIRF